MLAEDRAFHLRMCFSEGAKHVVFREARNVGYLNILKTQLYISEWVERLVSRYRREVTYQHNFPVSSDVEIKLRPKCQIKKSPLLSLQL